MKALMKMTAVEMKLFFRDPQSLFWTFLFPFITIYLLGFLFGGSQVGNVAYKQLLIPNMMALTLTSTSLFILGMRIVNYKESGLLRTYQITPLGAGRMIGAFCIMGLVVFLFSMLIAYLSGWLLYGIRTPVHIIGFWGATLLCTLGMFPLGILLTGFSSTMEGAAGIGTLALNVQLLLSGGVIPYQLLPLPLPLKILAKCLPLHYVNDLLTAEWTGQSVNFLSLDVGILAGMAVLFSVLSIRFFRWS
ncbi:ABC transporter permease [Sporolactobacillus shoreae]|uniref:Transport permease protein n=1 Tax=Sporolactobacillus shoreae TaxID=1465501 RepID=A0A4Z0GSE0_9BACL|nr:ABC transporter permease [Sporolactobacillus shoreae]TGA99159.1 ABC transporter permease [Sporolactobacillus shoreae]